MDMIFQGFSISVFQAKQQCSTMSSKAIHPTDLRHLLTRGALEHCRNRQKPTRLRDILRSLRKPANLARLMVRPHRNRLAHGKRASVCHLESGRR
jgi:hypothetical protein